MEDSEETQKKKQTGLADEKKKKKAEVAKQLKNKAKLRTELLKVHGTRSLADDDIRVFTEAISTSVVALIRGRLGGFSGGFGGAGVITNVVDNDPTDGVIDTDQTDDWFFDMDPTDAIYNVDKTDGKPSDGS